MYTGFRFATRSGASIGIDDARAPGERKSSSDAKKVKEIEAQYMSGLVTWGERYNNVIDIWSATM